MDYVDQYQDCSDERDSEVEGMVVQPDNSENKEKSREKIKLKKTLPKQARVQNPRPKLDSQRLIGERGIGELVNSLEKSKFRGKGYEQDDLNVFIAIVEHWAHRLMPSMRFDDVIHRIEKLGVKREVKSFMHKLREGRQLSVSNSEVVSDSEKSANESPHGAKATSDDEKFSPKENGDMYEEELWPEVTSSKRKQLIYSDDEEEDINLFPSLNSKVEQTSTASNNEISTGLSQEQKGMIAAKRLAALERRKRLVAEALFND